MIASLSPRMVRGTAPREASTSHATGWILVVRSVPLSKSGSPRPQDHTQRIQNSHYHLTGIILPSTLPTTQEIDKILAVQFVVAQAGESAEDPKGLGWWQSDLVDPLGGGDFLKKLLPGTHRWATHLGPDLNLRLKEQSQNEEKEPTKEPLNEQSSGFL
jgi:hypothetical protein